MATTTTESPLTAVERLANARADLASAEARVRQGLPLNAATLRDRKDAVTLAELAVEGEQSRTDHAAEAARLTALAEVDREALELRDQDRRIVEDAVAAVAGLFAEAARQLATNNRRRDELAAVGSDLFRTPAWAAEVLADEDADREDQQRARTASRYARPDSLRPVDTGQRGTLAVTMSQAIVGVQR